MSNMVNINFDKHEFTWKLGWSNSRMNYFNQCKRKYAYMYYSKHLCSNALKLKELTTIPLEIGNMFHDFMMVYLQRMQKTTDEPNMNKLYEFIDDMCITQCQVKTFIETYYDKQNVDIIEDISKPVKKYFDNFYNSDLFRQINSIPLEYRTNQYWNIEGGSRPGVKIFGETRIDDMKCYSKLDFIFIDPVADLIHIIDWKTGQTEEDKHIKQMQTYAAAISELNPDLNVNIITPICVYVNEDCKELETNITDEVIQKAKDEIRQEIEDMESYLIDVVNNTPKPLDYFPCSESKLCKSCQFQEICKQKEIYNK